MYCCIVVVIWYLDQKTFRPGSSFLFSVFGWNLVPEHNLDYIFVASLNTRLTRGKGMPCREDYLNILDIVDWTERLFGRPCSTYNILVHDEKLQTLLHRQIISGVLGNN